MILTEIRSTTLNLLNYDFTVNDQAVFPALDIDIKTRCETDNMQNVEDSIVKQYRIINKASAVDLLSFFTTDASQQREPGYHQLVLDEP